MIILDVIIVIICIIALLIIALPTSTEWYEDAPWKCQHEYGKWYIFPGGTFQLRFCSKCGFRQGVKL